MGRWPSPRSAEATTASVRRPCGSSHTICASCQSFAPVAHDRDRLDQPRGRQATQRLLQRAAPCSLRGAAQDLARPLVEGLDPAFLVEREDAGADVGDDGGQVVLQGEEAGLRVAQLPGAGLHHALEVAAVALDFEAARPARPPCG